MATVAVTLAATARTARRRVVLTSAHGVLTLPVTNPQARLSDVGAEWTTIPRPGEDPLLRRAGTKLRKLELDVNLMRINPAISVEKQIDTLEALSDTFDPIGVSYGPGEAARTWRLVDVRITTKNRFPGTNAIKDADATLEFWEHVAENLTVPSRKAPPKKAPPKKKTGPKRVTYVVKRGDTLSKIAAKLLHDANRWPEIAKLNKIRNPNTIKIGQKLIVEVG